MKFISEAPSKKLCYNGAKKIMNTLLKYLNLIIGVFAIVVGGIIPINSIVQAGSVGCSDALGFAMLVGGVVLLIATHYIDKGNFNKKYLYFLAILVLSYIIQGLGQFVVQSFYGLVGQFDVCTMFIG